MPYDLGGNTSENAQKFASARLAVRKIVSFVC